MIFLYYPICAWSNPGRSLKRRMADIPEGSATAYCKKCPSASVSQNYAQETEAKGNVETMAVKPERSHHCRRCNCCYLRMDHHCPMIQNCVGERNFQVYITLLGFGAFANTFFWTELLLYIYHYAWPEIRSTPFPQKIFTFVYHLYRCSPPNGTFWGLLALFVMYFTVIIRNGSSIEDKSATAEVKHRYRFPFLVNLKMFFGSFWLLLLPRFRMGKYEGYYFDKPGVDCELIGHGLLTSKNDTNEPETSADLSTYISSLEQINSGSLATL